MILFSKKPSRNSKLSEFDECGIPQKPYVFTTYREVGSTCHKRCGFHPDNESSKVHGKGCYALAGNVGVHSRRSKPTPEDGSVFYERVLGLPAGAHVRLHVSGDFYKPDPDDPSGEEMILDREYLDLVLAAFTERPDVKGWTYIHGPLVDLLYVQQQAPPNLNINWSCDDYHTASLAQDDGVTGVTAVMPEDYDPKINRIKGLTMCPEQTHNIPCTKCKLCFNTERKTIVGFYAHR